MTTFQCGNKKLTLKVAAVIASIAMLASGCTTTSEQAPAKDRQPNGYHFRAY